MNILKKSLVYLDDSIYLNYLCMYLFVIMYRTPHPLYVKTSKNVKKTSAMEVAMFFQNEGGVEDDLCKNNSAVSSYSGRY